MPRAGLDAAFMHLVQHGVRVVVTEELPARSLQDTCKKARERNESKVRATDRAAMRARAAARAKPRERERERN